VIELLLIVGVGSRLLGFLEAVIPVACLLRPRRRDAPGGDRQIAASREDAHPLEQGTVSEEVLEGEIFQQAFGIELRRTGRNGQERLRFGGKQELAAAMPI